MSRCVWFVICNILFAFPGQTNPIHKFWPPISASTILGLLDISRFSDSPTSSWERHMDCFKTTYKYQLSTGVIILPSWLWCYQRKLLNHFLMLFLFLPHFGAWRFSPLIRWMVGLGFLSPSSSSFLLHFFFPPGLSK